MQLPATCRSAHRGEPHTRTRNIRVRTPLGFPRVPPVRRHATSSWALELPEGMLGRAVDPAPDSPYTTMWILHGWLHDTAPATVVVTTRPRKGVTLRSEARRLSAGLLNGATDGDEIELEGARGARRIDGLVDLGEGVSEDGVDRLALVIAAGRVELVMLSIRTRPADEAAAEVEAAIRSFTLPR
jgi:hypothetical protein